LCIAQIDYHFVPILIIEKEIAEGNFVEHAKVHGNYYGTSKDAVKSVSDQGRICVLDIDVQGVQQVQEQGLEVAKYLFIQPPTIADLEARLRARGTETEERIAKRVGNAQGELDASRLLKWDARIINDNLDAAYAQLRAVTEEERARAAALRDALAAQQQQRA
jgi:guanylate kinase